jgi:predicted anti-sigma-YlaC factor YlaD
MTEHRDTEYPDVPCQDFVELVTDYLEGVLDPETMAAVEHHLGLCQGCREYLDQIRATKRAVGHVSAEALPQAVQDELVAAFTGFRRPSA